MSGLYRILIVDHAPVFGGVEAMINDLALTVDRGRFALTLATDTYSHIGFKNIALQRLPLPPIRRNPVNLLAAGRNLATLAREYDLIMTTTARTHPIGALAARLSGKPLIWYLADNTFPLSLASLFAQVPQRILAISAYIAGRCSPAPDKTQILYHGLAVPPELANQESIRANIRQSLGIGPNALVVISAARLVRMKGHALLVQAINQAGLTSLIAGGEDSSPGLHGGRGLLGELKALGGQNYFLGHRTNLRELFAASDIFVHVPTLPEAFGRTIVEAMLAGLPVIAARIGGIPEVVGQAGRLIPANDAVALAAALHMDAPTRARLGQEGRARALAHFELGAITHQLESIWCQCLEP